LAPAATPPNSVGCAVGSTVAGKTYDRSYRNNKGCSEVSGAHAAQRCRCAKIGKPNRCRSEGIGVSGLGVGFPFVLVMTH
jgi:hypothetical protein